MQFFCIFTPKDENSKILANRCIQTAKEFGHTVVPIEGVSKKYAKNIAIENRLSFGFDYLLTKADCVLRDSQIACFLAHRKLWEICLMLKEPIVILEHDAYFTKTLEAVEFDEVLNLQREIWDNPSWTWYEKLQILIDKDQKNGNAKYMCLPGASAYALTPLAAKKLCSVTSMLPLDISVNKKIVKIDDHPSIPVINVTNDYTTNR